MLKTNDVQNARTRERGVANKAVQFQEELTSWPWQKKCLFVASSMAIHKHGLPCFHLWHVNVEARLMQVGEEGLLLGAFRKLRETSSSAKEVCG